MKTALLLSGHMRYFKECFSSLKRSILDTLNPDIYVHTWNEKDRSMWKNNVDEELNNLFFKNNNIVFKKVEIKNWNDTEPKLKSDLSPILETCTYYQPIRMFSMYYKIQKSFELIDEKYDLIIRARPDLFYHNIIDNNFNLNESFIKIPLSYCAPRINFRDLSLDFEVDIALKEGVDNVDSYFLGEPCDCGGYLDQFAIGDYSSMKTYCTAYDSFKQYFERGYRFGGPEEALKHHLDFNKIKIERNDLKFYIMRNWRFL